MARSRLAVFAVLLGASAARAADAPAGRIDFAREIRPVLTRSCVGCHNADKQRGGLRLDDGAAALRGGNSGPVIKPGDAAHSRLVAVVAGPDPDLRMPPAKRPPLSAEEVGRLRAWVDQGAKWPQSEAVAAPTRRSTHWAFQPVRRPPVPAVANRAWVRSDVDAFVLARREKEGIAPSPEADRVTLLRRLSLDLLGLPPTPAEVGAFLRDTRPGAYERVAERCWRRRTTASAGAATGSTPPVMPTATATTRTPAGRSPGATAPTAAASTSGSSYAWRASRRRASCRGCRACWRTSGHCAGRSPRRRRG